MSYVKTTNFLVKDSLLSGDPAKLVRGSELDDEFNAIQTADADNAKGAATSTDNAVPRYDGTTGKTLQNSLLIVDDSGNVTGVVGLTASGDLSLTGSGKRITGDFSNATVADRVMFQTSTVNGSSNVSVVPNGTGTLAVFEVDNAADPTNSSIGQLLSNSTEISLRSALRGTGTYLPMTFYTGGSERMRIDTSGNVGIGGSPNITGLDIMRTGGQIRLADGVVDMRTYNSSGVALSGTQSGHAYGVMVGAVQRMNFDLNGNSLHVNGSGGLGYGTGAGGTVTQATSKATAVTLNKPTGQITMNNAALAAGASVTFILVNSLITANDTLIANTVGYTTYKTEVLYTTAGSAGISVTNISGGSLSEAVLVQFALIKGATT